ADHGEAERTTHRAAGPVDAEKISRCDATALAGLHVLDFGNEWSSRSANESSRQPKWICASFARSAQRRNARSSTICGTLLGISGVGQSEYGRGRRPNSWPQKRVT